MSKSHQLSLPPGYALDRYRLWEVLGCGSFGITYLARDLEEERFVAIKELLPAFMVTRQGTQVIVNSPDDQPQWDWAQQRFREEAEALLHCNHPNVLKVHCTLPANGTVYMVTRYEEGQVMEKWLRKIRNEEQRSPTEEELVWILGSVLQALEHVHAQGFLHRDIKPENIYLTHDRRVVLLDFGNARQVIAAKTMPVTTVLTHGYAPPEQYWSASKQGKWTDLYAVGGVMYRAITDEIPPDAVGRSDPEEPDPCKRLAEAYAGKFGAALLTSIDRALEPSYRKRFQSAEEWKEALALVEPKVRPVEPKLRPAEPKLRPAELKVAPAAPEVARIQAPPESKSRGEPNENQENGTLEPVRKDFRSRLRLLGGGRRQQTPARTHLGKPFWRSLWDCVRKLGALPSSTHLARKRIERLAYFAANGIGRLVYFCGLIVVLIVPFKLNELLVLLTYVLFTAGCTTLRLKNIGDNPWSALFNLIPGLNLFVIMHCLVVPAGYAKHGQLDRAGKLILAVFVTLILIITGTIALVFWGVYTQRI